MRKIEHATPELQDAMDNIIDVIACTDGGPNLCRFVLFVDRCAAEDNEAGRKIQTLIIQFSRLLRAVQ